MSDWEELLEHLRNVLRCLINIAPTRNRFTQMLFLIKEKRTPLKLEEGREIWPETFKDTSKIAKLVRLGIEVGDVVRIKSSSDNIASRLCNLIEAVFWLFKGDRKIVLQEIYGEELPDLEKEWIKHKLLIIFSEESLGEKAKEVLKIMKECSEDRSSWSLPIKTILEKLKEKYPNVDEVILYKVRDLLWDFGIIEYSESEFRLNWNIRDHRDVLEEVLKE